MAIYGNIFIIVSNSPDIIGIDIEIIITFPPISTLLAIALSPESLHILTANSVKSAIPVIFMSKPKNSLFNEALLAILVNKLIIPEILENTKVSINAPAINETYIVNSGLYCFIIIIIIRATNPIPYNLYNIHLFFLSFGTLGTVFYLPESEHKEPSLMFHL